MNTISKRFLAFTLSFVIIFSSVTSANAATSTGGWTALDTITAGATNTINAVKGAGATGYRSAVTVAPSAVKVGKHLIKGGGQAALAYAVVEILGEGIDWVLDPANNSVRYTDPTASAEPDPNHPSVQLIWTNHTGADFPSAVAACKASIVSYNNRTPKPSPLAVYQSVVGHICYSKGNSVHDRLKSRPNPAYNPDAPAPPAGSNQDRHIPIATVATKVIANAEAGHAPSQEAVKATALEGFAAGEHDAALDAAAVPDTGVENPPDTDNPPKDPDAPAEPAEPFDPAGIISAINALKAMLAGILSSITSLSDWFQSEPPPEPKPEDTQLDIPVPDVVPVDTDINFGGSCPANFEFNGSIFGNPINIVLLDTSKFCGFLSTFVKYPVYALSSLYALYILGGRKDV